MIVFVKNAAVVRSGLARITLDIHGELEEKRCDGCGEVATAAHGIILDTHDCGGTWKRAPAQAPRMLAAAAYRVAARLETFAGAEGFDYSVSAAKARIGVVEISYVLGGMDGDGMDDDLVAEIAIDACGECDL